VALRVTAVDDNFFRMMMGTFVHTLGIVGQRSSF